MADLPRVNWGDGSWADVQRELDQAPLGFDWATFWNDFLWFGEPPDKLYRDVRGVVADQVSAPIGRARDDIAADVGAAVASAGDAAADAATSAAASTWRTVAPFLAVGALVFLALEVRRAR